MKWLTFMLSEWTFAKVNQFTELPRSGHVSKKVECKYVGLCCVLKCQPMYVCSVVSVVSLGLAWVVQVHILH